MRLDDNGNLVVAQDDNHIHYIPAPHVRAIARHLLAGKPFWSYPVYPITRQQAAFIMANVNKIPLALSGRFR